MLGIIEIKLQVARVRSKNLVDTLINGRW